MKKNLLLLSAAFAAAWSFMATATDGDTSSEIPSSAKKVTVVYQDQYATGNPEVFQPTESEIVEADGRITVKNIANSGANISFSVEALQDGLTQVAPSSLQFKNADTNAAISNYGTYFYGQPYSLVSADKYLIGTDSVYTTWEGTFSAKAGTNAYTGSHANLNAAGCTEDSLAYYVYIASTISVGQKCVTEGAPDTIKAPSTAVWTAFAVKVARPAIPDSIGFEIRSYTSNGPDSLIAEYKAPCELKGTEWSVYDLATASSKTKVTEGATAYNYEKKRWEQKMTFTAPAGQLTTNFTDGEETVNGGVAFYPAYSFILLENAGEGKIKKTYCVAFTSYKNYKSYFTTWTNIVDGTLPADPAPYVEPTVINTIKNVELSLCNKSTSGWVAADTVGSYVTDIDICEDNILVIKNFLNTGIELPLIHGNTLPNTSLGYYQSLSMSPWKFNGTKLILEDGKTFESTFTVDSVTKKITNPTFYVGTNYAAYSNITYPYWDSAEGADNSGNLQIGQICLYNPTDAKYYYVMFSLGEKPFKPEVESTIKDVTFTVRGGDGQFNYFPETAANHGSYTADIDVCKDNILVIHNFLNSGIDVPLVLEEPKEIANQNLWRQQFDIHKSVFDGNFIFSDSIPTLTSTVGELSLEKPRFFANSPAMRAFTFIGLPEWDTTDGADNSNTLQAFQICFMNGNNDYFLTFSLGEGKQVGISEISSADEDAPAVYYNLQGVRVNGDNLTPGVYIKRQGNTAIKILVK